RRSDPVHRPGRCGDCTAWGSSASAMRRAPSIRREPILVLEFQARILCRLLQVRVADRETLDFGAHETTKGVRRRAHDGLASDVERRVDDDRATGQSLEL